MLKNIEKFLITLCNIVNNKQIINFKNPTMEYNGYFNLHH